MKKLMTGYRPIVHARERRMLGIRQPLDGPISEKLEHAEYWCWGTPCSTITSAASACRML